MRKGICLKNNDVSRKYVSSFVSSISNDVMINDLINDLINRSGVTNFFWTDDGFYYSLKNDSEFLGIIARNNCFYVSNNMDGICQQINCVKSVEGVNISINNKSKIDVYNNSLYRSVQFEKKYDCYGNELFESKVVNTCDCNNDPLENCCSIISKFFFDDEVIKVHSMSYHFKPYLNSIKYFIIRDEKQSIIDSTEFDRLCSKVKKIQI